MKRDQRCWLCHKFAPAGVCMGAHPDFNPHTIVYRENVSASPGKRRRRVTVSG